ncbi:CBS domain-containing protein [Candidatus Gottesmanbacteria bacterium]|nr:CBS domain-containing protein [Candidatus Gottesmanbacteria bacterium]
MKIYEIMSKATVSASSDATFRELWKLIFKRRVNAVPVVDKKNILLGLVTKEDLLQALYPDYREYVEELSSESDFEAMEDRVRDMAGRRAKDVMCRRVIYTRKDSPIMRALSRMIVRRVNQLPVLDENDTLCGMVTKGDIFNALFRKQIQGKKRKN